MTGLALADFTAARVGGDAAAVPDLAEAETESASALTGLVLVDAGSGAEVVLADRDALVLADPANGSYGLAASVAADAGVGSVRLELSAAKTVTATDNAAPYSLHGDEDGTVSGAGVRKAKRKTRGSNQHWTITVEPAGWVDVSFVLPGGRACTAPGAICTADGKVLVNTAGARIRDAEATGTIVNSDRLPRAWLARFGRTAAGHVLDAVSDRLAAPSGDGQVTVAGQRLSAAPAADTPAYDDPLQRGEEPRTMQLAELVDGSSFAVSAAPVAELEPAGGEDGGRWSVWGRGGWSRFEGARGELSLDGQVITATVGADYERDRLLGGLAVAYSAGDGTFDHAASGRRLRGDRHRRPPDRGVALSVAPSWGTTATTAATLWSLPDAARLAADGPAHPQTGARLAAEFSDGQDALGGAATVSPYAGLTVADSGTRAWRVGARFRHDASLSLSLEGTRSENVGAADPKHTVELRASLRH